MSSGYYYSHNGQRFGPVDGQELKVLAQTVKLLPTDLIWKEGMAEWKPASKAKGLFPAPHSAGAAPTPGAGITAFRGLK